MGKWFAKLFKSKGVDVLLFDRDATKAKEIANEIGGQCAESLDQVLESQIVLIAVNLSNTPDAINEIGSRLNENQILIEISSLKANVVDEIKKLKCEVLSMHPLFGPGAQSIEGENIAIISDISSENTKEKIIPLLSGASISECTVEEHDRNMALVLSLPFAMNMAFVDIVRESKVPESYYGSSFRKQLAISTHIDSENEDLKKELIKNPMFSYVLESYMKKLREIG